MPHVVLRGDVDLAAFARDFRPILVRRDRDVLRADKLFRDADGTTLLVECLVIESGRKQPFYVKIGAHDRGSVTIRVDPMTHPERSDGVKQLVACVASAVLTVSPGAEIGAANVPIPSPTEPAPTDTPQPGDPS